jgi:protein-tyrosine phosphatase
MRSRQGREGLSHVVVDSSGTLGIENEPAPPEAVAVARRHGVDLTRHRSRGIQAADFRTADHVVVMTREHLEELGMRFPKRHGRRWLLRAFESGSEPRDNVPDLDDPIGGSIETYARSFDLIRVCVDHFLLFLKHSS